MLVDFQPVGRRVQVAAGQTILAAAQQLGLALGAGGLTAPCGGRGLCGRCRVRVAAGDAGEPAAAEKRFLKPEQLEQGYRLACQAVIQGPLKVEIPPESMLGIQKLQVEGLDVAVVPEAPVKRYNLSLTRTTIENPRPLWQQVAGELEATYGLDRPEIDFNLALVTEPMAAGGTSVVTVRGKEVINIYAGRPAPPPLGLAVDLGTTKVAGFLINLETGATLAADGIMNPQIAYGEDVMARLGYALEGEQGYRRIQEVAIEGLNRLAATLAGKAGVTTTDIEEAVIVGNTAMHHLLLHLPVEQLARAPYVPALTTPVEVKARSLGLNFSPGAYVYFQPVIAGFVGGDHVAMILGSRIDVARKVTLGLDIGTNTEIVLSYGGKMLSCSCASGPAFEGAHIAQGMRAITGAIAAVRLSDDGREVYWESIGGVPPLGICGSGILDAVAELYRTGVINANGRLDLNHPRVRRPAGGGPLEFLLVPAEETGIDSDLVVTQKDIGEIQLAKAAIASGTLLLLEAAGLTVDDLEEVVVAGAFGTHLKLESAIAIGMFPKLPLNAFRQVGNAAGTGARLALLSMDERRRGETIARQVGYIELMTRPSFRDVFMKSLLLP
ncbi:ASKHA domain-containing protein [Moorella sp. E306M]|uniref:ASKHA domain-containing protein n=1 Tax=Moorella sp. E306M TaxID=2572683 RepID=UPI00209BE003|nr:MULTISPECIES: ASKHA domain-containing protein [unclassified Moorella (in: firmicutes)]